MSSSWSLVRCLPDGIVDQLLMEFLDCGETCQPGTDDNKRSTRKMKNGLITEDSVIPCVCAKKKACQNINEKN